MPFAFIRRRVETLFFSEMVSQSSPFLIWYVLPLPAEEPSSDWTPVVPPEDGDELVVPAGVVYPSVVSPGEDDELVASSGVEEPADVPPEDGGELVVPAGVEDPSVVPPDDGDELVVYP